MNDAPKSGVATARPKKRGKPTKSDERSLNREAILEAAVALIDEIGLDAFSVRALAQRLEVYPAAIYWWLPTRNDVLAGVVSHALQNVQPPPETTDWKEWIADLMRRYRSVVQQHPKVAPLITSQLVSNAGVDLKLVERLLSVLKEAGFEGAKLLAAYDVVLAAKIGFVSMEFAMPPQEESDWADRLKAMTDNIDAVEYPNLSALRDAMLNRHFILRWQNGAEVPLDESFEAHVYTTIEGLRMLLTR
ncbi:TetR/AcrR family transcriptional regulator [Novosphingobium piscinae]|uniref:TetR/AcrR family transcriptional regulator n=1 Tax=Novosphingobium piscinae TaxID=1507448 RepID=A0A7X1FZN8_9SPHN|nr:TetR/AcrR family transcriptional regulator [Novosphingobium piscinae]MBC2669287.1 TetR/AcrR family transcriptional regulator [Novosphingobium piscinae]